MSRLNDRRARRAVLILQRHQEVQARRGAKALRAYWRKQAGQAVARFNRRKGEDIAPSPEAVARFDLRVQRYRERTGLAAHAPIPAHLGTAKAEDTAIDVILDSDAEAMWRIFRPFVTAEALAAARLAAELVGVEALTISSTPLADMLLLTAGRMLDVNTATRVAVQITLAEGQLAGYNDFQIARGVPKDGYRGLRAVVQMTYKNRDLAVARTEMAITSQRAAHDRYEAAGLTHVDISDGPGCGWTSHDDADVADGSRRTIAAANKHPIAHPNCVRVSMPVL